MPADALSFNEKQFRQLIDTLWSQTLNPMWVCKVVQDDFEMVSANEAAFRVDANQKPGVLLSDVVKKSGHDNSVLAGYFTCLEKGEVVEFEQRPFVHGKEMLFRTLLVPIKNSRGAITHIWGTAYNLSDLLDAQLSLEQDKDALQRKLTERTQQLHAARRTLEELATKDSLTQIANRQFFDENLTRAVLRANRGKEPLALILIEADYFKRFNQRYGMQAGDESLQKIAQVISQIDLRQDDVVARFSGNTFAILMPNCEASDAERIAKAALQRVQELKIPHETSEVEGAKVMTVTIGVAVSPFGQITSDSLFKEGGNALDIAKASGHNCVRMTVL
ncbi:GGDEF domain-containing protein [Aliidiomarina halalkaliphila]|uniref:diguanylate cyclase n=1 Tax=Aliidiomarina halalkaliphila TaxID=2593535 RepID=A0A552X011_9GAMM|nr:diguanylate cyclase [Aliidiomarina halalkaliphila]TRW48397.1 GGDEF domain-containing protein [Aliidiomarina halalkaliphila]